ncbi:proteoglycan 4 isoform X3 [Astyanax mexicanus]|uniref:proteoglycan 4 isoform X3 n=1 Tax=Astyanax mexicanus TaxID=7994 RepID=UPI0020CAA3B9|nr:proteoglycan 4 isoform X3 [Astyanax mexicanus]
MEVLQGLFVLLIAVLTSPQDSVFCVPQIAPENTITRLSSPLTLNCSSSCPHGKATWKVMQDSLFASVNPHGHYSTMEVQSITMEHTSFTCEERCDKKRSRTVKLYHFLGPTITTDPKDPETGQPFQVKCEVKIHPGLSAELELTHGERVLSNQTKCPENFSSILQTCEVSSKENILVSEAQYKCEATLRKDSSQRIESANLSLKLRAALTTHLPTETTPLAKETVAFPKETTPLPTASTPKSTASVVTKEVTIQTDLLNTQSNTALKKAASTTHLPTDTTPLAKKTEAVPKETTPLPKETTPLPTETTPLPKETTPLAKKTVAFPKETTPLAKKTVAFPKETTPLAKETVAFPKETTPLAKETVAFPKETTPLAKVTVAFPKETTPPPTASTTKSTASVVTKRVTIQTDLLNTQSNTALKSSAAVRTSSSASSSDKQATLNESSSSTIWVAVIICVVILVLVICFVLFFCFKKRKEAQPQQKETLQFCNL